MRIFARAIIILFASLLTSIAIAASVIEVYDFSDDELRERYQDLIAELRCPKCQNQNLAGSDAPIAVDLRREVRNLLEEGATDGEIKDFLVERYGVFVLYSPPVSGSTLLVWVIPFALLSIGLLVAGFVLLRNHRVRSKAMAPAEQTKPPASGEQPSKSSARQLDEEEWS